MATIYGTAGNDTLTGVEGDINDVLVGLAGDDRLFTTNTASGLYGGSGNDMLRAQVSALTSGEPQRLRINENWDGGLGDDSLLFTETGLQTTRGSADIIHTAYAGDGDDLIRALSQLSVQNGGQSTNALIWNFNIDGGSGDDRILLTSRLVTDSLDQTLFSAEAGKIKESVSGGSGYDLIRSIASIHLTSVDVASAYIEKQIDGGDGNDTIFSSSEIVSDANGSATIVDTITGGDGDDRLTVVDTMTLTSETLSDLATIHHNLDGGDGNDTLRMETTITLGSTPVPYGDFSSVFDGGNGNDRIVIETTLNFTSDAPFRLGQFGEVHGGDGNDWIEASVTANASAEQLQASYDQYGFFSSSLGFYIEGNDGNDTIQVSVSGSIGGSGSVYGGVGNDRMFISLSNSIYGEMYAEGGAGNDLMVMSVTNSINSRSFVLGGDGNDKIIVSGGNGEASVFYVDGNLIYGGAGNDTMTGSDGIDTFAYEPALVPGGELINGVVERDVITNFGVAEGDAIQLEHGAADVTGWRVAGGNTVLTLFGDGDLIVLRNVVIHDLSDILFA